jgi:TatD DNase family protein
VSKNGNKINKSYTNLKIEISKDASKSNKAYTILSKPCTFFVDKTQNQHCQIATPFPIFTFYFTFCILNFRFEASNFLGIEMELIDSHCHLTYEGLYETIDDVLGRSRSAGVTKWVNVGTTTPENKKSIELAEKYPDILAAVGWHPHHAKEALQDDLDAIIEFAKSSKKVVAIGETGLDFHYNFSKQDAQQQIFAQQAKIAADLNLPLIVHSRNAFNETMEILNKYKNSLPKLVFHCFTGTVEQAKIVLANGWHISFSGVVTFKNALDIKEVAKIVPLDKMLLETDCPFLAPEPMRKQKTNEPALLTYTAQFIANLRGENFEDFARQVNTTTKSFFSLP